MRHCWTHGRRGALLVWLAGLLLCLSQAGAVLAADRAETGIPPEMEERVVQIFELFRAALQDEYPELDGYTIRVVDERMANAWINQHHEISVTTGLLELLPEDDALAGVIGHEIAHGLLGHIPHRVNQSLWSAFAVLALGLISNTEGKADWGGLWQMRDLFMYAYSREQESEADMMGLRLATRAGYDKWGLVHALERMDEQRRSVSEDSIWHELYRTHPPISQRVADLRMMMATDAMDRTRLGMARLSPADGPGSPEEAARRFAQALWSGNRQAMEELAVPGLADKVAGWAEGQRVRVHSTWAAGELEIADRWTHGFDEVLVVRLWRAAAGGTGEESTPPVALTLRRSARGWLVADWSLVEPTGAP